MKFFRKIYVAIFVIMFFTVLSDYADAIPSAEFRYIETELAGGLWQYDYTISNTSDPILDAGFDLYEVFFEFEPSAMFNVISLPTGWDEIDGGGFVVSFSTIPGIPPFGYDVAPGEALGEFSFLFDYKVGNVDFESTFAVPNAPATPFIYSSTSAPYSSASVPIPEPSTLILIGFGLLGLSVVKFHAKLT